MSKQLKWVLIQLYYHFGDTCVVLTEVSKRKITSIYFLHNFDYSVISNCE